MTVGSFDGAEICELVGLFILSKLGSKIKQKDVGLYRCFCNDGWEPNSGDDASNGCKNVNECNVDVAGPAFAM